MAILFQMQQHFPILIENIPEETFRCENLYLCENIELLTKGNWLTVLQMEKKRVLDKDQLFTNYGYLNLVHFINFLTDRIKTDTAGKK